jgi:hypothetical protein
MPEKFRAKYEFRSANYRFINKINDAERAFRQNRRERLVYVLQIRFNDFLTEPFKMPKKQFWQVISLVTE